MNEDLILGENVEINVRGKFEVGPCSYIGNNVKIDCEEFITGEYLYIADNVEIGRGGCKNPEAIVHIGNHVGIFENTIINPNSPVTIGNNVGIGAEVMIWTHGAWLDITQGFPSDFGPVTIGDNVWLPARSIVLPNVTIGNNVVIGINSIVNKNLPSGCMAAGQPCKVLRENQYPKHLDTLELQELFDPILDYWWNVLKPAKKIKTAMLLKYNVTTKKIELTQTIGKTFFDTINKTMEGHIDEVAEDLRDYLRRNGLKIYTGKRFKSLPIK